MRARLITALTSVVLGFLSIGLTGAAKAPEPPALAGKWVMHVFLGSKLFDDVVEITQGANGELGGTLVVPDRFSATIEKVVVKGDRFSFEITADEGEGPFTVRYEGTFHPTKNTYVGFASFGTGELLGGFVGQRK